MSNPKDRLFQRRAEKKLIKLKSTDERNEKIDDE